MYASQRKAGKYTNYFLICNTLGYCSLNIIPIQRENQKYCSDECRKDAKYADTKRYREELKVMKRKRKVENNPFNKILKELDEYNRKNNCFLSYGQFVLLKQKAGDTK